MVVEEVGIFAVLLKELPSLAAVLTGVIILGYLLYTKTLQITQKNEEANQKRYADLVTTSQTRYEELTNRYIDSMSKIVGDNTRCMTELCSKIDSQIEEIKEQRSELKEHITVKDKALEILENKDETIKTLLQRNQDLYDMLRDQIRHSHKNGHV